MVQHYTDTTLIGRIHTTSQQVGCCGFTFNREGYSAVKSEVDAWNKTIFGVGFHIVEEQRERALAFWSAHDLARYIKHGYDLRNRRAG